MNNKELINRLDQIAQNIAELAVMLKHQERLKNEGETSATLNTHGLTEKLDFILKKTNNPKVKSFISGVKEFYIATGRVSESQLKSVESTYKSIL